MHVFESPSITRISKGSFFGVKTGRCKVRGVSKETLLRKERAIKSNSRLLRVLRRVRVAYRHFYGEFNYISRCTVDCIFAPANSRNSSASEARRCRRHIGNAIRTLCKGNFHAGGKISRTCYSMYLSTWDVTRGETDT